MSRSGAARTVALYPWYLFARNLMFWQAVWFLAFQDALSGAEAIVLYAVYDVATTVLEVPSGYLSDRIGRRITLILSAVTSLSGAALLAIADSFAGFALGQALIGAGMAFASGTDSAILYESLAAEGRGDEIERQELRAWRFSFMALALAAVTGGAMARADLLLPFAASALAFVVATVLTFGFAEPPRRAADMSGVLNLKSLGTAFRRRDLTWIFALAVVMYGFSHVPFVFGQPFILSALEGIGLAGEAPLVSGAVTAAMMAVSLGVSFAAPGLRRALGLGWLLCIAFALQIAISATLALTGTAAAIAILLLRMVPDALSRPFVLARIQPHLGDAARATYLSVQSLAGRILFAASLWVASRAAGGGDVLSLGETQAILAGYCVAGVPALVILILTARKARIDAV